MIGFARFAGIEKPMPTLPPVGEKIAVFIPKTSPSKLKSGPPGVTSVYGSVCLNKTIVGTSINISVKS